MIDEIDETVLASHRQVRALEGELERAKQRRILAFALAAEKGRTSGDLARLTGVTPMQALHQVRTGSRLINLRRARSERRAA
jgi:hypothetical protein